MKDDSFNSNSSYDFISKIYEFEEVYDKNIWIVTKELLLMEDGYLRYDSDKEEFLKAKARDKEHFHPENHLDIFYKNTSTIKFGFFEKKSSDDFIDSISSKTECHYLDKFNKK